jgi:ribonuclease J
VKIIIHRGTHQIDGSCLEVATATTRLILDVGLPLDDLAAPFPIPAQEHEDETVSEVFARSPEVAAVLISHAHADHTGLLHLVPPGVPIFLSKGTSKMMLAGSVYANQPDVPRERQQVLELRSPHRIGDITVTAFPVDHSAFDAQAFLLEADGQRVLYSGDLRLHGRKPGMARTLLEALSDKPVDALVMEGTHFAEDRQPGLTETQLEDVICDDIRAAPGLVLAAFSPMHVDRLVTFYKAARRAGRIFVVDHYAAFVFFLVSTQARIPRPERGAGIRVFLPKRRKRVGKLEERHAADLIYLDDILAEPTRYVMPFRPSMLEGDFAAGLPPAARCIYSYWHGYLKKPDWQRAQAAVAGCGGEFLVRHTSGHIHSEDIVKFVEAIGPRHVLPIHTTRPEAFRCHFPHAILLHDGEAWETADRLSPTASPGHSCNP